MGHKIIIEAVAPEEMRLKAYQEDGCGDWFFDPEGNLTVRVAASDIFDDEAFLVALHELVEAKLCLKRGITQQMVDDFDQAYDGWGEPGDDQLAPYREPHRAAMLTEHMVAHFLGITDYGRVE